MSTKKIISTVLALCMSFSAITASAEGGLVNAGGSGGYTPSASSGKNNPNWTGDGVEGMWGYRVSVYVAFKDDDRSTTGNPIFKWDGEYGTDYMQVGNTIDLRQTKLKVDGDEAFPAWWGKNIFEYTTRQRDTHPGLLRYKKSNGDKYIYAIINANLVSDDMIQQDLSDWHKEFDDDVESMEIAGNSVFNDCYTRLTNFNLTSETMELPLLEGNMTGGNTYSVDYLKSWLIQPTILNLISTYSANGTDYVWTFSDFYNGEYVHPRYGVKMECQYKIYVEPIMARMYNGSFAVVSWKDIVEDYIGKSSNWDKQKEQIQNTSDLTQVHNDDQMSTGLVNYANANKQISSALSLESSDPTLRFASGDYMGNLLNLPNYAHTDLSGLSQISEILRYIDIGECGGNYLGVGVVTSPSIKSYTQSTLLTVRKIDKDTGELLVPEETITGIDLDENTTSTTIDVTIDDPEGYEYHSFYIPDPNDPDNPNSIILWNDDTSIRHPQIELTPDYPQKIINIQYVPDGKVASNLTVHYWNKLTGEEMYSEEIDGGRLADGESYPVSYHITDWEGYEYDGWNLWNQDKDFNPHTLIMCLLEI